MSDKLTGKMDRLYEMALRRAAAAADKAVPNSHSEGIDGLPRARWALAYWMAYREILEADNLDTPAVWREQDCEKMIAQWVNEVLTRS